MNDTTKDVDTGKIFRDRIAKKEFEDKATELFGKDHNPLLDELGKMNDQIAQMTEVDVQRTKTIFGMMIDGLQYLTLQAEGNPKGENTKNARNLLAHYFNIVERAKATLRSVPVADDPPSKILEMLSEDELKKEQDSPIHELR